MARSCSSGFARSYRYVNLINQISAPTINDPALLLRHWYWHWYYRYCTYRLWQERHAMPFSCLALLCSLSHRPGSSTTSRTRPCTLNRLAGFSRQRTLLSRTAALRHKERCVQPWCQMPCYASGEDASIALIWYWDPRSMRGELLFFYQVCTYLESCFGDWLAVGCWLPLIRNSSERRLDALLLPRSGLCGRGRGGCAARLIRREVRENHERKLQLRTPITWLYMTPVRTGPRSVLPNFLPSFFTTRFLYLLLCQ